MDKKKIKQYGILIILVVAASLVMPKGIRFLSNQLVERILHSAEKESESESEAGSETEENQETELKKDGTYSIGNPELYVENHTQSGLVPGPEGSDPELARKYESEVAVYEDYVTDFNPEYVEAEKGIMDQFLVNKEKFHDTIATYAFVKWGSDRKITRVQFDAISISEVQADAFSENPDDISEVYTCLIEFFHTSHPDTENGTMSFCVYNKSEDTYSFT